MKAADTESISGRNQNPIVQARNGTSEAGFFIAVGIVDAPNLGDALKMNTIDDNSFPSGPEAGAGERWLVMKFGGTSVSTAAKWATVRDLIRERIAAGFQPVVVHSALADVSDRIEAALAAAVTGQYETELQQIVQLHADLAGELGLDGEGAAGERFRRTAAVAGGYPAGPGSQSPRLRESHGAGRTDGHAARRGLSRCGRVSRSTGSTRATFCRASTCPHENERSRYLSASCSSNRTRRCRAACPRPGTWC